MTNPSSFQPTQSFFRVLSRWLPDGLFGGDPVLVAVEQKAPPRLSLAGSFVERPVRRSGPNLPWSEAGR